MRHRDPIQVGIKSLAKAPRFFDVQIEGTFSQGGMTVTDEAEGPHIEWE